MNYYVNNFRRITKLNQCVKGLMLKVKSTSILNKIRNMFYIIWEIMCYCEWMNIRQYLYLENVYWINTERKLSILKYWKI